MVRAPCCEKMGLKKGPWTPEEDRILVSYILTNGHGNWRALPKQAGLLRCGKSCRLRWTNYLRPDIKRGDFSKEEEETIIHLHAMLGNRWSAIAAKLPRRTDNEIKNLWHTHLKKSLNPDQITKISKARTGNSDKKKEKNKNKYEEQISSSICRKNDSPSFEIATENGDMNMKEDCTYLLQEFHEIGEELWSEEFRLIGEEEEAQVQVEEVGSSVGQDLDQMSSSNDDDGISFWMKLLAESANLELVNASLLSVVMKIA